MMPKESLLEEPHPGALRWVVSHRHVFWAASLLQLQPGDAAMPVDVSPSSPMETGSKRKQPDKVPKWPERHRLRGRVPLARPAHRERSWAVGGSLNNRACLLDGLWNKP